MDCNKDEAVRAKDLAEKKMETNDFEAARRIALKAQTLYPELDNITQLLTICDVHCSAQKGKLGSDKDWYAILQIEKFADESTVKKQYRRLALILHPDKNRFPGAEGAFKLICEANALLSDSAKKSSYDSKVRVSSRYAPVNPHTHLMTKNSQLNKQYSAQNNTSNGFSSLNQHQTTQPTSSVRKEVFWTCCPFCGVKYQYLREYINRSLRCQSCSKVFVGYEVSPRGVSTSGQPGAVPSKSPPSRASAFQEKVVQNQGNCKMNDKGPSVPHAGSQGIAGGKGLRPKPGVQIGSDSEGTGNLNTDVRNVNSQRGGKERKTEVRNKSRKRGRKLSSDSCASSDSDVEDLTMKGNFGESGTDLKSESSRAHLIRRSSRKRQHFSYQETDEGLKGAQTAQRDNGKEQNVAVDSEDSKHGNQSSFPSNAYYSEPENREMGTIHSKESLQDKDANCNKEGKARGETGDKSSTGVDTVQIESDSDQDISYGNNSDTEKCDCPDPEFSDFDKEREESRFHVNQFWACYDTSDGMPRFYAKVKKVSTSPFELSITWLEADPIDDAYEKWVDEELPVGCGSFKLGQTDKTSVRISFSHQVHCEKGKKRGSLIVYPRQGEVWAIFKDWDISWSLNPENHKEFKYEIVEVLSDFVEGTGIKVGYLDKITGFVSLFQRASESQTGSFWIQPNELYKFSHCVPCFKMTGNERGVPVGSFELDPASLPMNPDDLYYPSKAKMEHKNMNPGAHPSPPKPAMEKGKSVASENPSTPKKFVDLEGIQGEMSQVRKSPRGVNVIRQNAN